MTALPKIVTEYDPPPIPARCCDWRAWRDDIGPEWGCGWGATEAEAIAELVEMIEERAIEDLDELLGERK